LIVLISIVSIVVLLCTVSIIIIAKKYRVLHNGDVCVEAIQQAITNENYDKAYKLATQFKDRATEIHHGELALVQVYLDMGEFEKAKELVHICERNGNYYPSSKKPLGIYLIALGKYAEAEEYMNCKYWEDCGEYIYLCVENMCKIGQTKEARTFYNRKIKQYAHLYDNRQIRKQELSKKVNNLIASYNR
jgi:lipopolysaccharide biosynthesis regulator YciM